MKKHAASFIILVMIMILSLFLVSCNFKKAGEDTNTWEDPKGDAPDKTYPLSDGTVQSLKALDIVRVKAEGKDGAIHVVFTLNDSFDDFYSQVDKSGKIHTSSMAEVYIDTDNSTGTGGAPPVSGGASRPLKGYDVYVSAMPSLKYKNKNGTEGAVSGDTFIDTKNQEMTGYGATYFIKKVPTKDNALEFDTKLWHANKSKYSSAKGDTFDMRIPYAWLGLKPGDTVRICYREMGQNPASGISISDDKLLRLE